MTDKQRHMMLAFMEGHPAFQRGELIGQQGRNKQRELKLAMANQLNACGDGVSKDATKWMKVMSHTTDEIHLWSYLAYTVNS